MFYAILIIIAVGTFLLGFRLGSLTEPKIKTKALEYDSETNKLKKEYENFLNYDGNEQS